MRLGLESVNATSIDAAVRDALRAVGGVLPERDYVLSAPVAVQKELEGAGR